MNGELFQSDGSSGAVYWIPFGLQWKYKIQYFMAAEQKQVAFQSNANRPLAESTGYIKFDGM